MHFDRSLNDARLAIIGLGYVGLPLAVEIGKKRDAGSAASIQARQ